MVGKILQTFAELPIISLFNRWTGAFFGVIQAFAIVFIAVQLTSFMPGSTWKETINDSRITRYLLELSPRLSEQILEIPKPLETKKDIL